MIKDYLYNLGLDVIKNSIVNRNHERNLREMLGTYIDRQTAINNLCSREEEIDFQGIIDYIRSDFLDDVITRMIGVKDERAKAHKTIVAKAKAYAHAQTDIPEQRAAKIISDAINIVRGFFRNKVPMEMLLVSGEIVDDIEGIVVENTLHQTEDIKRYIDEKVEVFNNPVGSMMDYGMKLMEEKQFSEVESILTQINSSIISVPHELHPYYKYALDKVESGMRLKSVPTSPQALNLYPPRIQFECIAKLNGKKLMRITQKDLDYSYRHQMPITISILDAKKLLGDIPDPLQHDAEEYIGETFVYEPEPFPPAFPCSISYNDIVEFDYVLLRTQEILDDGTYVISNKDQDNASFYFEIAANLKKKKLTFNIRVLRPSNEAYLKFARVMKKAEDGEDISIKVLSLNQELTRSKLSNVSYTSEFGSLDEEVKFFEMIVMIEKYFKKTIKLPEDIMENDYDNACYLYALINGKSNKVKWKDITLALELDDNLRNNILTLNENTFSLCYVGTMDFHIWGETFSIPIRRHFLSVIPFDLRKMKAKASVLDDGDEIKLKFIPGEGDIGIWEDTMHTDENI